MTETVDDIQVLGALLTEEKLEGYSVKPWTIKQLMQVTPILKGLGEKLKGMGVTLDNFSDLLAEQGLQGLAGLVDLILPQLPEFLSISLRIPKEEAEEMDLGLALALAVRVLALNIEHLKNSFGLITGQMNALVRQSQATH
ncbi:MAG: hypothetical protein JRI59_11250 [Deltaproteobacteria bacterium]|nr:hypothetical protein [Deltaproteobacteria bacterium]